MALTTIFDKLAFLRITLEILTKLNLIETEGAGRSNVRLLKSPLTHLN